MFLRRNKSKQPNSRRMPKQNRKSSGRPLGMDHLQERKLMAADFGLVGAADFIGPLQQAKEVPAQVSTMKAASSSTGVGLSLNKTGTTINVTDTGSKKVNIDGTQYEDRVSLREVGNRVYITATTWTNGRQVGSARGSFDVSAKKLFVNLFQGDDFFNGGNARTQMRINGSYGNDHLIGGNNSDEVIGSVGDDKLYGGASNDEIFGGDGNDRIDGGSGNDELHGEDGRDRIFGGIGADTINGGDDRDSLYGQDGNDVLNGGKGNDYLSGGRDLDFLSGNGGNDSLHGNDGNDVLVGGNGNDRLYGGNNNDVLSGGDGRDNLYGGNGNDSLYGGFDGTLDYLYGNAGSDKFYFYDGFWPWSDDEDDAAMDFTAQDTIKRVG